MTNHDTIAEGWHALDPRTRASLLLAGQPFPGETATEARCRLKHKLGLVDDDDLQSLLDNSDDTLARWRVEGKGPRPVRVARQVFYAIEDVRDWMMRHRDDHIPEITRAGKPKTRVVGNAEV